MFSLLIPLHALSRLGPASSLASEEIKARLGLASGPSPRWPHCRARGLLGLPVKMRGVSGQTGLSSRLTGYPELTQYGARRKPGQPDYSKPPSTGLLYQIQDLRLGADEGGRAPTH